MAHGFRKFSAQHGVEGIAIQLSSIEAEHMVEAIFSKLDQEAEEAGRKGR